MDAIDLALLWWGFWLIVLSWLPGVIKRAESRRIERERLEAKSE